MVQGGWDVEVVSLPPAAGSQGMGDALSGWLQCCELELQMVAEKCVGGGVAPPEKLVPKTHWWLS